MTDLHSREPDHSARPSGLPAPAVALAALLLLLLAQEASAQELAEIVAERFKSFLVLSAMALVFFQVLFVRLGAWLLKLEGGLVRAAGAVLLAGILGLALGFAGAMLAVAMPPAVRGVAMAGVGFAAGGLAVKLLFRTDIVRGMIVYLLAATANLVTYSLILIGVY